MKVDSCNKVKVAVLVIVLIAVIVVVPTGIVLLKDDSSSSTGDKVGEGNLGSTSEESSVLAVSSSYPSSSPSTYPSTAPASSPTENPTVSPTKFWVEPNPVPRNPPQGYFNYDINDDNYGPNVWNRVDTSNHYMREFGPDGFGAWENSLQVDPTVNRCTTSGTRQSPKDLVQEDGIVIPGDGNDGICDAQHEIRTRVSSR
jgi:hypothetical protein